jgi:hypothetical protein
MPNQRRESQREPAVTGDKFPVTISGRERFAHEWSGRCSGRHRLGAIGHKHSPTSLTGARDRLQQVTRGSLGIVYRDTNGWPGCQTGPRNVTGPVAGGGRMPPDWRPGVAHENPPRICRRTHDSQPCPRGQNPCRDPARDWTSRRTSHWDSRAGRWGGELIGTAGRASLGHARAPPPDYRRVPFLVARDRRPGRRPSAWPLAPTERALRTPAGSSGNCGLGSRSVVEDNPMREDESFLELGDEAGNWLVGALLAGGVELFEGEDPKYRSFLKKRLDPPPGAGQKGGSDANNLLLRTLGPLRLLRVNGSLAPNAAELRCSTAQDRPMARDGVSRTATWCSFPEKTVTCSSRRRLRKPGVRRTS